MASYRLVTFVSVILLSGFVVVPMAGAKPDPRLLSLILPTSQIIAGMSAPQRGSQPSSFLLMTGNNREDLGDFLGLIGVDNSRIIHQVIFTAGPGDSGALTEHSLLASGTFNQEHVFAAAIRNGAKITEHNGFRVLVVNKFERDRFGANGERWLAFPVPSIAILGSVSSVQQELDRQSSGMRADDDVSKRLIDLSPDLDAWCVLLSTIGSAEIGRGLASIDPELTRLLRDGDRFQFGIRYGEKVRFEYQISSTPDSARIWQVLDRSLLGRDKRGNSDSYLQKREGQGGMRRTIKISRERYEAWIQEVSRRQAVGKAHVR